MEKTLIKVECTDQKLRILKPSVIASGGRNEDIIEFSFCPLWDGFEKFASFYRNRETVYQVPIIENQCTIPNEVLVDEGWVTIAVFGMNGDVIRTSEEVGYHIERGALTSGTKPSEPTPELWERILAEKVSIDQGTENVGKILGIGSDGMVIPVDDVDSNSNLINGEAEGSLRSINAAPETEGYKLGKNSVAIGEGCKAGYGHSFSIGKNAAALAMGAVAQGIEVKTGGACGHSEGNGTESYGTAQHVQGRYNIKDILGRYAHIVGNGDFPNRSNAHTLDWQGNAWFAGDVIVGGKSQDDADAKILATQEYVDGKVAGIEIPSIEGLATQEFVENKFNEIEIPSTEGLATEKFVEEKISEIEFPEVPSLDGYATEKYVDDKIANSGGGSGGGAGAYIFKVPADFVPEDEIQMVDSVSYDEFAEILYNGGMMWFDFSDVTALTEALPLNPLRMPTATWGYADGMGILVVAGLADMGFQFLFTNGTWTPPTP